MSIDIDDNFLYQYIPLAERAAISNLPSDETIPHTFSERFKRKMQAVLKLVRRRKAVRIIQQCSKAIAIIAVVLFLVNAAVVVSVEAYRSKFISIITEAWDDFTSIIVNTDINNDDSELSYREPSYLPEGFKQIDYFTDTVESCIIYANSSGEEVVFTQKKLAQEQIVFDTEDATVTEVDIEGISVYVIQENRTSQLYWNDGNCIFTLIGMIDCNELILIARSIIVNNS